MEKSKRLLSLDVFRGITIMLMIVVNNPGSWSYVYSPLRHSKWNGCTPTDLVFPFFMFIMGVAMYYSFKKFDFSLNRESVFKVLKRSCLIFFIGLLLHAFPFVNLDLSHLRIMGVLERIGLAYGLAALIILGFQFFYVQVAIIIILICYWLLLLFFGGNYPFSLTDNFVRIFDTYILGQNHMELYSGVVFDETGLLSTFPSIATVLFGFLAGRLIDKFENRSKAVIKILIYGILLITVGGAWNLIFPLNKSLWTSSFVLYTAGWAMVILSFLLWIVDIKGYTKCTHPMLAFGKNPLFIYVLSCVWADILDIIKVSYLSEHSVSLKAWMFAHIFSPLAGNMVGSLLFAIHLGIIFWLIGWWMDRQKIYIRI